MQIPYEEELCALADAVWETPEPGFREYKSSAAHVEFLKKHGFEVKTDVAKTGTGYEASWGSGHPVIAFLGEFDALYGMNQKADCRRIIQKIQTVWDKAAVIICLVWVQLQQEWLTVKC